MSEFSMFEAKQIYPRTWQITYSFVQFGEKINPVFSYLLEGDKYSLVIDTMYGYGNLRKFCETLTDKPMKVVNTHFHGDHIGGNYHFDEAYIHWRDFPYFYSDGTGAFPKTVEALYERAKSVALEEYKDKLDINDFKIQEPMVLYPIEDGDVFDLGDRELEVIWVGGHSPGCIALLDRVNRCAFTGDCCNSNTLLGGGLNGLSVQQYLKNLIHFYSFRREFDITYGGHQILPARVVEEGIELCGKIIAGTDDKVEYEVLNRRMIYGSKRGEKGKLPDGKVFNMSYRPDNIKGLVENKKRI